MALFGKRAIAGNGPAFDVQPANPSAFSQTLAPFNFIREMAQGACAGLLSLLGVMHLTDAAAPNPEALAALTTLDAANLSAITENLMDGGIPGIVEIIGAAVLFMNAGRGWAKILGLMGFVAILTAHANGVAHADILERVSELLDAAQSTVHRIQTAQANS